MKNWICTLVVVLVLISASVAAHAVAWSAAISEGITSVDVSLDMPTSTYTWVLTNTSGTPACPYPDETVLVWSFQPFNVYELASPDSWTAPDGWEWDGVGWQNFEIVNNDRKYYTPPAVAPGQSLEFTYTFNPMGDKINPYTGPPYPEDPDDIGFIAHVAAVEPRMEPINYDLPWVPDQSTTFGGISTWYDRSLYNGTIVPEPGSLVALGGLGLPLAVSVLRRRRRG